MQHLENGFFVPQGFKFESPHTKGGAEKPKFSEIDRICRNVGVVEFENGEIKYQIRFERDTKNGKVVVDQFKSTIPDVLHLFERVLQNEAGLSVTLGDELSVFIPGELQEVSDISQPILRLPGRFAHPLTPKTLGEAEEDIAAIREKLSRAVNPLKVDAGIHLQTAIQQESIDEAFLSGINISNRLRDVLDISKNTLRKWRVVYQKREGWETRIVRQYNIY